MHAAITAVDIAFGYAGAGAVYAGHPLERCFRDSHVEAGHFGQLNVHQDQIGQMLAGEREGLDAVARLQRLIAMRLEQITKQLHVQLIVFDDENGFGHRAASGPVGRARKLKFTLRIHHDS